MKTCSAIALGVLALGIAGCALSGDTRDRALRSDPSFREGYEDGCAAATDQGADLRDRPVGDKQLYAADEIYRAGWSSGFGTCRRTVEPNASPGDHPISVPEPGAH